MGTYNVCASFAPPLLTLLAVASSFLAAFSTAGAGVSSTVRASFFRSSPASCTAILSSTRDLRAVKKRRCQGFEAGKPKPSCTAILPSRTCALRLNRTFGEV